MNLAVFTISEVTRSDALGVNFVTALDFSVNLAYFHFYHSGLAISRLFDSSKIAIDGF